MLYRCRSIRVSNRYFRNLVNIYQTTLRHIPEENNLHNHRCVSLKSHEHKPIIFLIDKIMLRETNTISVLNKGLQFMHPKCGSMPILRSCNIRVICPPQTEQSRLYCRT
jgi:hypothetical protein